MSDKSQTFDRLRSSKPRRDAYVSSQINIGLPFQIKALRRQRNWSQKDLADQTQMRQPRISAMEKPGYSGFSIETLKRLASAFDVALVVRYAAFSELVDWAEDFSPDQFSIASFEDDDRALSLAVNLIEESRSSWKIDHETHASASAKAGLGSSKNRDQNFFGSFALPSSESGACAAAFAHST